MLSQKRRNGVNNPVARRDAAGFSILPGTVRRDHLKIRSVFHERGWTGPCRVARVGQRTELPQCSLDTR